MDRPPAQATDAAAVPLERRPLPDQLRFLARKLSAGTSPEAVAFTLQVIADEMSGAASEALSSLAAELDEWAGQMLTDCGKGAYRRAASLARVRARGVTTERASVSGLPGDSPGGTGPENPAQTHEYLRTSMTTRQGRKVPRMLYRQVGNEPADDDPIVGLVDTPELAALIVSAVNAWHSREAADA